MAEVTLQPVSHADDESRTLAIAMDPPTDITGREYEFVLMAYDAEATVLLTIPWADFYDVVEETGEMKVDVTKQIRDVEDIHAGVYYYKVRQILPLGGETRAAEGPWTIRQ